MMPKTKGIKKAIRKSAKKKPRSKTIPSDTCFTIMPFGLYLDDYYDEVYVPAIKAAGLVPHRADDLFRPSTIVNDIWDYTKKARVVLADLTGKNPNVFYELGLAHALAKPAILLAESMDDIPFDLRSLRILVYNKNEHNWGATLRSKIVASIKEVLASPSSAVLPAFLNVSGTQSAPTVTPHQKELLEIRQDLDLLKRQISDTQNDDAEIKPRRRVSIGPLEASRTVARLLAGGLPSRMIVSRMASLGIPSSWVESQIRTLKRSPRRLRQLASEARDTL